LILILILLLILIWKGMASQPAEKAAGETAFVAPPSRRLSGWRLANRAEGETASGPRSDRFAYNAHQPKRVVMESQPPRTVHR
jgi:hypothetical protein